MEQRYLRQSAFSKLGVSGQAKLKESRVAIVGVGALGTVIANNLARAGVGYLRLIDRDFVELHNLHRQILFSESDVADNLPKAIAAKKRLLEANSQITIEAEVEDFNAFNAETLINGVDLVLDGTDNRETRHLINEACCKHGIPWVFGGALGSVGMTMNIVPGVTACYHCMTGEAVGGTGESCSTAGVLNTLTSIIASYQATEAIKILTGSPKARHDLIVLDIWENTFHSLPVQKKPDCPVCGLGEYHRLQNTGGTYTTQICGQDAVQVVPGFKRKMDFAELSQKLEGVCDIAYNDFILNLKSAQTEISLFSDGRAIIKNAGDANRAKSIYTEYFG